MSGPHNEEGFLELPTPDELRRLKGEEPGPRRPRGWVGPSKPPSAAADRKYVPTAIRRWRKAHGLSAQQAQVRIGLSPKTNSWARWECGLTAPSYMNLLRIISATGLGYWMDEERAEIDPTLRMDIDVARERERKASRGR